MIVGNTRWLAVLLLSASGGLLYGQAVTGSITGIVQDTSGAVIPGAAAKLMNTGTGTTETKTAGTTGNFEFLLLPPGTYSLDVSNAGFKGFRQDGIIVQADRSIAIPVVLSLGETTETVEVQGSTQQLDSNTSSVGTVLDRQKFDELPLVQRNPFGLAQLTPTVKAQGFFGGAVLTSFSNSTILIGGGTPTHNSFMLDGAANDKLANGGGPLFTLSEDNVLEFKVVTNAMSAEFGRTGGGIISVVSRSGTNEYHGTLYDFLRNSDLNSNAFFSNKAGAPKPALHLNDMGGTLGGPIKKDKLFFFLNAEVYKERRETDSAFTSPTALQREGNFSQTFTANGKLITIYDPLTTVPNPASPGASIRMPFPNNIIPPQRLSVISQQVFSLYPMGNLPGLPVTQAQNLELSTHNPIDRNVWSAKADYVIDSNQRLAVRYGWDKLYWYLDDYFNNLLDNNARRTLYDPRQSGSIVYTNALSPSLVLYVSSGINRDYDQGGAPATSHGGFDQTTWGFPAALQSQLAAQYPQQAKTGLTPGVGIRDLSTSGNTVGGGVPEGISGYTWANSVSLTKIIGSHTLKGGYEFRYYQYNPFSGGAPSYTFDRGFTQGPNPTVASANAGYGVASFELGDAASGTYTTPTYQTVSKHYDALFMQDDWKLMRNLTLNLGLRWDYESPVTDRNNIFANFDPSIALPLQVPGLNLHGGLTYAGVNGNPRSPFDPIYNHFGPRFGFAYQATSKIVVRGGYGVLYEPEVGSGFNQTTGFSATTTMNTSLDGGLTPYDTISNPFPGGLNSPTNSSLGALTGIGTSIVGQLRNIAATGLVQEWNFTVQAEPIRDLLVEVGYIGNKGTHLINSSSNLELDQISPQNLTLGNALNQKVANPFYGTITSGPLAAPTVSEKQLLLPYPQYVDVVGGNYFLGNSIYHAATVKVEKRLSHGVSLLATYVFSKLIDDVEGGAQNWYNLRAERSTSVNDVPQRAIFTPLWNLPFGQGATGWRRQVMAGWELTSIFTLQSGTPINFGTSGRPNVVSGCNVRLANQSLSEWFNTACFTPAAPFTYGDASRTIPGVFGPGIFNVDLTILKDFFVTERMKVQLRASAYNLTNTPQFQNPGATINSATFGVVTATGISGSVYNPLSREMQFALRLSF